MPQVASVLTRALQTESLSADTDRLINDILLESGVVGVADDSFQVTQDTGSNMQVKIGSGSAGDKAVIKRDGRAYILEHQNASQLLTVAASDPNDDRIDLVVARIYDDEADSSGNTYGDIEIVQGTPAGSPTAPALPAGALALAEILVAEDVTAITNGVITDLRQEMYLTRESRDDGPRGWLGGAAVVANQSGITSITDLTGLSVTIDVPAGRRIEVRGQGQLSVTASGGTSAVGTVREGSSTLGRWGSIINETAFAKSEYRFGSVVLTPSGGSHTYKLSLERGAGAGTVGLVAAADNSARIDVYDIGPA